MHCLELSEIPVMSMSVAEFLVNYKLQHFEFHMAVLAHYDFLLAVNAYARHLNPEKYNLMCLSHKSKNLLSFRKVPRNRSYLCQGC
jgi:hypothetical protein